MEQEYDNCSSALLPLDLLPSPNLHLLLSFLDNNTIALIISAAPRDPQQHSPFLQLARIKHFLNNYINKTDRSVYMPFYSQPLFAHMEQQQLAHIATHCTPALHLLSDCCQQLVQRLREELEGFELKREAVDSIIESLTDPEFPFPKLRKQGTGMHCNSAFQFFLVDKLFPSTTQEDMQETFEQLRTYLDQKWVSNAFNQKEQIETLQEVFYSWFKITYQNYQSYLLPRNTHHNLIVIVVALLDLFVDSFCFYIQSIQDPFYSFTQFNMRFCIFRNMLLSLEEKLGFLFKNYSQFCQEMLGSHGKMEIQGQSQQFREMTIWHCGMSKWYIYMQQLHQPCFKIFFHILKKNNLQVIKQNNLSNLSKDTSFLQLQNRLEVNEIHLLERDKTFEIHSPIEDILDQSPELHDQIIKQYIQYIVDISVNQYSVHWCGHSSHVLHIPYQEFELTLVEHYQQYIQKLKNIAVLVSRPPLAFNHMLTSMIQQLDKEYLKPVTLKKIIKIAKKQATELAGQDGFQQLSLSDNLISIDTQILSRDKILDHFNDNAGISNQINYKYSIVLQNEDFNKLLKVSASTNASSTRAKKGPHLMNMTSIRSSDSFMEQDLF